MKKTKIRIRMGYQRIPHTFIPRLLKLPDIGYPEVALLMVLMPYFPKCTMKRSVLMRLARIRSQPTFWLRIKRLVDVGLVKQITRPGRTTLYKPGMCLLKIYLSAKPPIMRPFKP